MTSSGHMVITLPGRLMLVLGLCSLMQIGCSSRLSTSDEELFLQAEASFVEAETSADYLRAAAIYEQIAQAGVESGAVYFNQGNAFARAEKHGNAIACYRKATRFMPRNTLLQRNLAVELGGRTTRDQSILSTIIFWKNWLSYGEKFRFTIFAAVAGFGLSFLALWFASSRKTLNRVAFIGYIAMTLFGISAGYDWYRFDLVVNGVVTSSQTTARTGSSETFEPAITEPLQEGTEFIVIEQRQEWVFVRVSELEGWIPKRDVTTY